MTKDNRDWRDEALCANIPIEKPEDDIFFSAERTEIRHSKQICVGCPVRRECLQTALDTEERFGVWGGVDEQELRRALSINEYGIATIRKHAPRCPYCFNETLEAVERRRTRTHVQCSRCKFMWWTRRSMPKKNDKVTR